MARYPCTWPPTTAREWRSPSVSLHIRHGPTGTPDASTGTVLDGSGGGDAGRRIWRPAISSYLEKTSGTSFDAPSARLRYGPMITVPEYRALQTGLVG